MATYMHILAMGCTLTLWTVSMEMFSKGKVCRLRLSYFYEECINLISSPKSRPKSWDEDMNY